MAIDLKTLLLDDGPPLPLKPQMLEYYVDEDGNEAERWVDVPPKPAEPQKDIWHTFGTWSGNWSSNVTYNMTFLTNTMSTVTVSMPTSWIVD